MWRRLKTANFRAPNTAFSGMLILRDEADLQGLRRSAARLAFVPTMGNLHAGHASLIALARQHADTVLASIYVNPLQFGPNEDFARYPRSFERDLELLEAAGAQAVFAPDDALLGVSQQRVFVQPSPLAEDLCGQFRPGHFRGVATIVLKLLHLVMPDVLILGKKDLQQFVIVREMLGDLNLAIDLIGAPIVRDRDGLALSSRNQYLTAAERAEAPHLYRCLKAVAESAAPAQMLEPIRKELETAGWRVDYVALRDADTLKPMQGGRLVALGAAWLGSTRLIDNVELLNLV